VRPERSEGIARGTAYSFGTQFATAAFTAGLTLFLVRALDPSGYGLLALALAIGGLATIPSDLGISGSAARFVAESRNDPAEAGRVVSDALLIKMAVLAATSAALFASADWIAAGYGESGLAWPLRGVALAIFGHGVMNLFRAIFSALRRNSENLKLVTFESAIETTASVCLVLLGTGAAGAAFGRAIGYGLGALIGLRLLTATLGKGVLRFRDFRWARARRLARYAGVLAIVDGVWLAFGQVDALVVGAFIGSSAVGIYVAPMRFVVFLQYAGLSVATAIAPRLTRGADEPEVLRAFMASIRYLLVAQALLIAPLLVWAEPITELLLGSGYEESADVLRALIPFVFLSGVSPLFSLAVTYRGEARRRVPIAVAALALDLVLAILLVPTIGIVGAAIATDVAYALYVLGHLTVCQRLLGISLRSLVVTLIRSLVAAAVMCLVLLVFGTTELTLTAWVLGAVTGVAAFVAVLVATRELGRAELSEIAGLLARIRT